MIVTAWSWSLLLLWVWPLLLAACARDRARWLPAWGAVPALVVALAAPVDARLELSWLLLGSTLALDDTARAFLRFTALLWWVAGVYVAAGRGPRAGRFDRFFLLALAGNLWLIVARDLVGFYAGFALMSLAAYVLVAHDGTFRARRAGQVYLIVTLGGEVALFVALALIAAQTATFAPTPTQLAGVNDWAIGLLLFGLAVKAGLVPLHSWLALAHPAAGFTFVQDGRTVWQLPALRTGGRLERLRERFRALLGGFPGEGLMDVFGLWNEETDVLCPEYKAHVRFMNGAPLLDGQRCAVGPVCAIVQSRGATPLAVYDIATGNILRAVLVLIFGFFLSTVDIYLRPKLSGKYANIHPMIFLVGFLGGPLVWGVAGFIVGPLVLGLAYAAFEAYRMDSGKE